MNHKQTKCPEWDENRSIPDKNDLNIKDIGNNKSSHYPFFQTRLFLCKQIQINITALLLMKNYPHLYNHMLNKKPQAGLNRTPKKSTTITGQTLASKTSVKTLGLYNNTLNRDKKSVKRMLTRSIQQPIARSQNQVDDFAGGYCMIGEDEQLFSRSSWKLGKIRQSFPYKNIDQQLNEVLALIKEEKMKVGEKLKALKKSNDEYKKISQEYFKNRGEIGVNTEDVSESQNQRAYNDKSVGCSQIKIEQESSVGSASREAYSKLSTMLQEMNINPQDVLPNFGVPPQILVEDYKNLSEKQIIKIQKFFIKKLIQKISK